MHTAKKNDSKNWKEFEKALEEIINIHSIDNELNMADFVLAEQVVQTLKIQSSANDHQAYLDGSQPVACLKAC